jgi:hypothetical protein
MIAVVSTGKGCPDGARACCRSVANEGLVHLYAAADAETYKAAFSEMRAGSRLVRSDRSQIANLVLLIGSLPPDAIVIHLDGDDQITPGTADVIANAYEDPSVWLTYGSFMRSDGVRDRDWHAPFGTRYESRPVRYDRRRFRDQAWRASHLRTFRAGLFRAMPHSHLSGAPRHFHDMGSYFTTCVDRAIMLGMLELAGERYRVIQEVLCLYNVDHDRAMTPEERAIETRDRETIHAMRPLDPLSERPW